MSGTRRVGKTGLQGIEHIGLVGLDLKEVIAALGLQQFQQRALGVDGVARKKSQSRVGRQEFGKVILEASWFIRFVAADGPLIQRQLGLLQKNIEHLHGRSVGVETLAARLSVDGGHPPTLVVGQHRFQPLRERMAKLVHGKLRECSGNRGVAGRTPLALRGSVTCENSPAKPSNAVTIEPPSVNRIPNPTAPLRSPGPTQRIRPVVHQNNFAVLLGGTLEKAGENAIIGKN